MNNTFGSFFKQKRLEKNLTQKDIAKHLIISESAVSKWEKNVAHPDITLLPKLSEILGVSEHELITASIDNNARQEKSQAKKWQVLSFSWDLFFYIAYSITLITCFICNLATEKTLGWFWIVLSSLILAFTFTNLPKLIRKLKLLILPISMYLALCLLLGVCCIYTHGDWFWIAALSILLPLFMIFTPIYIAKFKIFKIFRKISDFATVGISSGILTLLLIIIDAYSVSNGYCSEHWFFTIATPITLTITVILNLLLSVKFIRTNKLVKTSIILSIINVLFLVAPLIKLDNTNAQKEIDDFNIFKANLATWNADATLENNIALIVFLTLLTLSVIFLIFGLVKHLKNKKQVKQK